MINHLQSNRNTQTINTIINYDLFDKLTHKFKIKESNKTIIPFIKSLSNKHRLDYLTFIKLYVNHLIKNNVEYITPDFIKMFNFIIHNAEYTDFDVLHYFVIRFFELLSEP